jgi:hypothetical protein
MQQCQRHTSKNTKLLGLAPPHTGTRAGAVNRYTP